MLLTRSPLGLPQCCHWMDLVRLACVRHAASVRPEPGSNSPSRSRPATGRRSVKSRLVTLETGLRCRPGKDSQLRHPTDASLSVSALTWYDHRPRPHGSATARTGICSSAIPFSRCAAPRVEVRRALAPSGRWCLVVPLRRACRMQPGFRGGGPRYRPCRQRRQPATTTRWRCRFPARTQEPTALDEVVRLDHGLRRVARPGRCTYAPPWRIRRRASLFEGCEPGPDQQVDQPERRASVADERRRRHATLSRSRQRPAGRAPSPNRPACPARPARRRRGPWTMAVTSRARRRCACRRSGAASCSATTRVDLVDRQQREPRQQLADLAVVGLHEVLDRARTGSCGPGRARPGRRWSCRASSRLAPVRSGQHSAWTVTPSAAADEVDAREDVAPLVRAADLQLAALVLVQPPVVVGLQQHVRELGVRDAVLALDPGSHRLPGQHLVDGHVLADVAQERRAAGRRGSTRSCRRASTRPSAPSTRAICSLMAATLARSVSSSRRLRSSDRPPGSPIMPVAPPARAIGWWPASLEPAQHDQADQVARCGGCRRDGSMPWYSVIGPRAETLGERVPIGRVVDQAAGVEVGEQVHSGTGR